MPHTFDWDNLDDIAIGLTDKFPDVDPLTVRFTDMHKWVTELPGFAGDPAEIQREQTRSHPDGLARRVARPPGITSESLNRTRHDLLLNDLLLQNGQRIPGWKFPAGLLSASRPGLADLDRASENGPDRDNPSHSMRGNRSQAHRRKTSAG